MRYSPSAPFDVVPGHEVQGIEVVLRPLAPDDRIEGIVLSARGIPVPRAEVDYAVHDRDFGVTSSIRAGEDGRFRLVVWRKVPHTFTARAEDGSGVAHAARVEPGTLDLVLRIGVADSYELVVTDPDGEPIESYQVETRVGSESSWTGRVEQGEEHPGGSMHLGLPEAPFWLEVRAVGYTLGTLGPFEPETVPPRVELVLEPAETLRGRVFAEGAPCAGVRVELYRALDPMARLEVNGFPAFWQVTPEAAVSAADGTFQLMPRGAGEYLVRAEKEGWTPGESRPLHLAEGAGAEGIEVHLGHGGTLVVQVVAAPGEDPGGVIVAVTRGDSHPHTRRADATGRAVFEGLMPGTWDVRSTDEELEPFTTTSSGWEADAGEPAPEEPRDVDVFEGRTTRYVLELTARGD